MLFGILIAVASMLVVLGIGTLIISASGSRSRQRLEQRVVGFDAPQTDDGQGPVVASLARGGRRVQQWLDTEHETSRLFVQAGWRSPESRAGYFAVQAGLPVLAVLALLTARSAGMVDWGLTQMTLAVFTALALGLLAPKYLLRRLAARRQRAIRREVPMFVHVLMLLFEAGLSTRQALQSMVREAQGVLPVLHGEMQLVLRQLDAGGDTATTFRQLGEALEVAELDNVLSVLRQADRYGGELREPLAEALAVLEEHNLFEMREQVNKMSGRMTVVMVACFFPALLIFVAGPPFVAILRALGTSG